MTTAAEVREALRAVTDPEIPVLTIEDLGVLRDVTVDGDAITVTITPTYCGCPAMDEIRADVTRRAATASATSTVQTVLSPGLDHRLDERGRPAQAAPTTASPRRGPVLAAARAGGLDAVRSAGRATPRS